MLSLSKHAPFDKLRVTVVVSFLKHTIHAKVSPRVRKGKPIEKVKASI